MRFRRFLRSLASFALLTTWLAAQEPLADGIYAEFTTPRGDFVIELKHREAPMTVASFVGLAEGSIAPRDGKPFYTDLKWYRVVPGFVIQSGDPDHEQNAGKEDAGHPYTYPDEFAPGLHHAKLGVLSMANAGPDTNSSEFFITLGDCTRLNYLHSVFGEIVRGAETLPKIETNDPFRIRIVRVGGVARGFKADEATFKSLASRARKYAGSAEPGPTAHFDDPAKILPVDPPRAKNFNAKLANFQATTGVKVAARILPKSPTAEEDAVPGAFMRQLATQLGVAKAGILAVYFADDPDWRVWFGDDLLATLLGRPVVPGDFGDDGTVHDAKTQLIETAIAEGDAAFATQQKSAPADRPPPPGQRVKLQTDALLDKLLLRFEKASIQP